MAKLRQNEASWSEKDQRWHIYVQSNGVRRHFVSSVGASSRKGKLQAERKADKWLEDQLNDENVKLDVLFGRWIDSLKDRTQTAYWKQYESYGRNWIKPLIGQKRMNQLNENDLDRVIAAAYKKGLSHKSLCNIRSCLVSFLKYARKGKVITLVPDDIIVPQNAPRGEHKCLSPDEVRIVLSSDTTTYRGKPCSEFYINAYRFLLLEGLRPGELFGLQWSDIEDGGYTVSRAINSLGEVTTGKNKNAKRAHALGEYSAAVLAAQKEMLKKRGMVVPYVFPDFDGQPMRIRNIYEAWKRYCAANGIRVTSLYELRHTNYSVNKDMPDAYKKMLFGHSAKFDGDAVYDHRMDGDLAAAARMNDAAFRKIVSGD